jgi:hypothetical protein
MSIALDVPGSAAGADMGSFYMEPNGAGDSMSSSGAESAVHAVRSYWASMGEQRTLDEWLGLARTTMADAPRSALVLALLVTACLVGSCAALLVTAIRRKQRRQREAAAAAVPTPPAMPTASSATAPATFLMPIEAKSIERHARLRRPPAAQ